MELAEQPITLYYMTRAGVDGIVSDGEAGRQAGYEGSRSGAERTEYHRGNKQVRSCSVQFLCNPFDSRVGLVRSKSNIENTSQRLKG